MKLLTVVLLLFCSNLFSQQTPLEKNEYSRLTSYDELSRFIEELDKTSDLLSVEIIGQSVEKKNIYALKFSSSEFGADKNKLRVLIFAQQHGNEQSGKEASLLLAKELLKIENEYLFEKIDFALIPQMNPDGSELGTRRNANNMDLNRNHLILTEPEVISLHRFFNKYLFEVTMDVHEYYPFTNDWKKFGYIKGFDVQVGALTNPNASSEIRKYQSEKYFPFIKELLNKNEYSFQNYIVGGPPEQDLIRHSTYDINDGRQSLGIQNSFSFIQEGINGENYDTDSIKRRAESQKTGMLGLLIFSHQNKDEIKMLVDTNRKNLSENYSGAVAIRMEHVSGGNDLILNLRSLYSYTDSAITVKNYKPVVKPTLEVKKPKGYLIPKSHEDLVKWAQHHALIFSFAEKNSYNYVNEYFISKIDSSDFEGDKVVFPDVRLKDVTKQIDLTKYIFIPTSQLKGNMIVQAFEPQSVLGLITYKNFERLLNENSPFPILRVEN